MRSSTPDQRPAPDPVPDLHTELVADALARVRAVTDRLLAAVAGLSARALDESSALAGWSRRTLLAHLDTGARASARMTTDVLAGRSTAFYPGGPTERAASLRRFDDLDADTIVARLAESGHALTAVWQAVPDDCWSRPITEERFGTIAHSRLVVLRLTELSVHGEDLDVGLDWPSGFADLALPLRVAWLPAHHHRRPDADHSIEATWLLTDGARAWQVTATGSQASVRSVASGEDADAVLSGTTEQLLRVLLGRLPARALLAAGDEHIADALKRAFPGP